MIWVAIGVLAAISFALKTVGPVLVGDRELDPRAASLVALLPVPMLAALVAVGTLANGHSLQVDARLPAVAVAAVCIWRRLPFLVVNLAAAATAALLRAL
jgi:branched chain amino acid efflux pump